MRLSPLLEDGNMNNLKLLEKPKLTAHELLQAASKSMLDLSDEYHKAERYAAAMKNYHQDLASLVKRVSEIKSILDAGLLAPTELVEISDEMDSINTATEEIIAGVHELKSMTFNLDVKDIDDVEIDKDETTALSASDDKFMKAYFAYKTKLNLTTQDDVARLVGLDRRQISNLENSKHKPQFKTIKKIAEGFGADIKEFI